jgi:protein TonB
MRGPATISVIMHATLIGMAFVHLGFMSSTPPWGQGNGGLTATPINLTPGIPLPPSPVESKVATDTKTMNPPEVKEEKAAKVEKKPEPPATGKAFEIKTKDDEKKRLLAMAKSDLIHSQKSPETNLIPGKGARASNNEMLGAPNASAGSNGIGFGGDFGDRYGWYVRTVRECLTKNWDRNRIDTYVRTAPKVFVDFDILRDGSITAERVTTSSGVPAVDREAIRATQACSGRTGESHLPALPGDFSGSKVPVEVYFDFKK